MFCAEVWRHPVVSHISMLETKTRTVFTSLSASLPAAPPPTPPDMSVRSWTCSVNMTFCTNVSLLPYVASVVCRTRSHTFNSSVKVQSPHFISCNTIWEPLEWKHFFEPAIAASVTGLSIGLSQKKKKNKHSKKHFEKKPRGYSLTRCTAVLNIFPESSKLF